MANSSIEQIESQIEMTEKRIKLIEQSQETLEKTAEQRRVAVENGGKLMNMKEEEFMSFIKEAAEQQRPKSALELNKSAKQNHISKFSDKENDEEDN